MPTFVLKAAADQDIGGNVQVKAACLRVMWDSMEAGNHSSVWRGTLVELSPSQDHENDNRAWSSLSFFLCSTVSTGKVTQGRSLLLLWSQPRLWPFMLLSSRWPVWTLPKAHCLHRLPWWLSGKESTCQCRRLGFNPWVRKIHWRRKWQPTPVF